MWLAPVAGSVSRPRVASVCLTLRRECTVQLPVTTDDGEIGLFAAHLVQHNNSRGPFKGGEHHSLYHRLEVERCSAIQAHEKFTPLCLCGSIVCG